MAMQAGHVVMLRADASGGGAAPASQPPKFDLAKTALLLDIDGTILEIAATPDLVHVPEGLGGTLQELCRRTDGAFALISGRSLHAIDELFAPLRLPAVGCHGAEVRVAPNHDLVTPANTLDPRLRQRLADLQRLGEGILVEDKAYSVALHYRLAPQLGRVLLTEVEHIAADFALTGIELLHGKEVIEVKSARFTKGTAVRELMREPPFAGRQPVFAGDDITDESVFALLSEFDGYGISVGRAMAGTQFCFARAGDVRNWLDSLLKD